MNTLSTNLPIAVDNPIPSTSKSLPSSSLNIAPLNTQTLNISNSNSDNHFWLIATCNLRGLSQQTKRDLWFQYCHNKNWDIIISTETDDSHQQSTYWKSNHYQSWWSHGTNNLGQGLGISLKSNLAKHTFKIQEWAGRIISIDLAFPQKRYLRILGVYYPTGINPLKQTVFDKVTKLITEASNRDWHIIIAGDFNGVPNPSLDKASANHTWKQTNPSNKLSQFLTDHSYIDSYRDLNPFIKQFTWNNSRGAHSRINQIWISPKDT
jgi:exonuclease III